LGAEVAAPLLLVSAGAVVVAPLLLLSAGAIAGAAGVGAAVGAAFSELLHAVSMSAAAARALRASFVFIDESPNLYEKPEPVV
jgi:C4-dicarboxylate transporter